MTDPEAQWRKRLEREKHARQEAERLLEDKSLELYKINQKLVNFNENLEQLVVDRTAELQKALQQAEEAVKGKNQFLAMFSHEIRTPLNAIIGLIQLLKVTKLNKEQLRDIDLIDKSGQNLLILVNDILDTAKLEEGKIELDPIPFDIRNEIETTIGLFQSNAAEQNSELKVSFLKELPTYIKADNLRLRQILSNLLSNAIKFTKNGQINVEVNHEVHENNISLFFSVKDTGIGIPEDSLKKLFTPFTQADVSTTRKFGGTGLGLTICSKLSELMDGTIKVESEVGKGSCFEFNIVAEITDDSATLKEDLKTETTADIASLQCLIVEDLPVNRMLMTRILKKINISADTACDGVEGFKKCQAKDYDIVFMDILMPNMNGLECSRKIRKSLNHQPWIIALTANAFKEDRDMCREAGMNDFLSKPIDIDLLKKKLKVYLERT